MNRIFRKILCIVLTALILVTSFAPALAAIKEDEIYALYFQCNGRTIKTVYEVPLSRFYKSSDGVSYGYVNLAAAFGEGAEDWYAIQISNSNIGSSIEKNLSQANSVFYFVTLSSSTSIPLQATVELYPKDIMPGQNVIQFFNAKTGDPKQTTDGQSEITFTWNLGDLNNNNINIGKYIDDATKSAFSRVEIWYGDNCRYIYDTLSFPASQLCEGNARATVKVFANDVYKLQSVKSQLMSNEWYVDYHGNSWSFLRNINPFGVEYIPVGQTINLLDYFSSDARSIIEKEIANFEKDGVDYEVNINLNGYYNQKGFNIDSDILISWMNSSSIKNMEIGLCSTMTESLFNQRYQIKSETASYTGKPVGISYSTSHPSYKALIEYNTDSGTAPINVGTYHYIMSPTNTAFLPYYKEGTFTITKAVPADGIPFTTQRVLYDGTAKSVDVDYLDLTLAHTVYENTATGEQTSAPTKIGMYNAIIEVVNNDNIEDGTLILPNAMQICESLTEHSIKVTNGKANFSKEIKGETITVTANAPNNGMQFDHWECDVAGVKFANAKSNKTTFVMPEANVNITAVYSNILYTVSVEGGSASAESAIAGAELTLNADEIEGKLFTGWTVVSGGAKIAELTQKNTTVKIGYANTVIRANFIDVDVELEPHRINIIDGTASALEAKAGEVITIRYTPSKTTSGRYNRIFRNWRCMSGNVTFEDENAQITTFIMPDDDVDIIATSDIDLNNRFASVFLNNSWIIIAAGVIVVAAVGIVVYKRKNRKD